jgi:5-formyltetrahydrofolate cyclo-ligase
MMMTISGRDWPAVREWRRNERQRLLEMRAALGQDARAEAAARIIPVVHAAIRDHGAKAASLYWPIKSELDLRPLAALLAQDGIATALPVIIEKGAALVFWQWAPGEPLERGFWNIPMPRQCRPIRPDAVLAPTVGFDKAGYRLGYGGGYFDRTLAQPDRPPLAIGIGFARARLATIFPQLHDIPMDLIVTEQGLERRSATRG